MSTHAPASITLERLFLTAFLLVSVLAMAYSVRLIYQDVLYTRARTEVGFWGREGYMPSRYKVQETGEQLEVLLQSSPRQPEYLSLHASFLAWQAYWSDDLDLREARNFMALQNQYEAALSRPAHRHSWSKVIEYAARTAEGADILEKGQSAVRALQQP